MPIIHSLQKFFWQWGGFLLKRVYQFPMLSGVFLSVLSSYYLITDYGVINWTSLPLLWQLQQPSISSSDTFSLYILGLRDLLGISVISSGYLLMIVSHAILTGLLLGLAKQLFFSKATRWMLIFLFLSHPNYNDFRTYVIVEPLFWCCWLLAVYILVTYYKSRTVLAIILWFVIFLFATNFTVAAWFWLLIFPFGTLFFKPWRRKSVVYALFGYALIAMLLLFMPVYQGESPIQWLITTILNNPNSLVELLELKQSNWVNNENTLMASAFFFSGATSLVIIRSLIVFGVFCVGLASYAVFIRQYRIVDAERLRILVYTLFFAIVIAVILFVLEKDSGSLASFSVLLLLFLPASLGLSYVFKKIITDRYSRLSVLVIVWCLVAYFASGFIIFGPRKDFLAEAGEVGKSFNDFPMYSNDKLYLFYAGENPSRPTEWTDIRLAAKEYDFYYAYNKNRKKELPDELQPHKPIEVFSNRRGDQLLIYRFSHD